MNAVLVQCPEKLPLARACHALGLNRSTVYVRQKRADNEDPPRHSRTHSVQPRALSAQERATVIETLHSVPSIVISPLQKSINVCSSKSSICAR